MIEIEGVTKRFGSVSALSDLCLSVPRGSVLGLLGPNGAGKTTLVRIVATLLRADTGRVTVAGHDVARERRAVRSVIGVGGQFPTVDENLTAVENLRLVARLAHVRPSAVNARVDELVERFSLADVADRRAGTYSGGMHRRLDLAATLVHRPPLLLLDEPTSGLDARSRGELWELLRNLVAGGTTLLLTTQYLHEAEELAHTIAVLNAGFLVAEGTPPELKSRFGESLLVISLASRQVAERAREVLAPLGRCDLLHDGVTLQVRGTDSARSLLPMARLLDAAAIEPVAIEVREPTLEDVVLELTGEQPAA